MKRYCTVTCNGFRIASGCYRMMTNWGGNGLFDGRIKKPASDISRTGGSLANINEDQKFESIQSARGGGKGLQEPDSNRDPIMRRYCYWMITTSWVL